MEWGGSFFSGRCRPPSRAGTQRGSEGRENMLCSWFQQPSEKKHPLLFNRLPLRTGAFRARRGHFNYRQRELRCPARSPAGGRGGEGRGRERRAGEGRFAGLSLRLGNGYGGGAEGHQAAGLPLSSEEPTQRAHPHWVCCLGLAQAKSWSLCPAHTGSASGQAYFEIESNCPADSAATETRSLPLVSPAIWIVCQLTFSLCWSILQRLPRTAPLVCSNI